MYLYNYTDSTFRRICAVPMSVIFESSVKDGAPGICKTKLGAVFATIPNAPITTGSAIVLR